MYGEKHMINCQSFRQGCCGCCVNMRWKDEKIRRFLSANTATAKRILPAGKRPRFSDLVKMHLLRGGWLDHFLMTILVAPSFGLSALIWRRFYGSCCFAGYIDEEDGRAGCLIHPALRGRPDLRSNAFPLVPVLGCDRELRCAMLEDAGIDLSEGLFAVSRRASAGVRAKRQEDHTS